MTHPAISQDRVAVITGGASGIGLATAQLLAEHGMRICISDIDEAALDLASALLPRGTLTITTDVSDAASVEKLKDQVLAEFGEIAILMNNAGRGRGGGAFNNPAGWHAVLGTNLWGVINGLQVFTQLMIDQGSPCAIINTGSKQGITNPPGDAAYNVSKAGIKTVTEHLAHELRNTPGCSVTAHLLVPGFTYTGLINKRISEKPAAAWTPEEVAAELITRMGLGDFYIICPDNDVTPDIDAARIQWNTDDLIHNRPALSRWHQDYEAAFREFVDNWP